MKKLLNIFPSWRCDTLILLWAVAALLFFAESSDLASLVIIKTVGVVLVIVSALLYWYWNKLGLIDEMNELLEEED